MADNLDFLTDTEQQLEEERLVYPLVSLLYKSLDSSDPILASYIDIVVPKMVEHFTLVPAKGSACFLARMRKEGTQYQDRPDQSMLSHVINGVFPTMRIINMLERENIRSLSEIERQLYLVGYTLHDLDKVADTRGFSVASEPEKAKFTGVLQHWVQKLGFEQFFGDWEDYQDDIMYLILNTQKRWGVDPLPFNYELTSKVPSRNRDYLADLCTFSDVISYVGPDQESVISPAGIREHRLNGLLKQISSGRLYFCYHQISEVKGLLSNVINNSVMSLLKSKEFIPFLFFPNGVIYLSWSQKLERPTDGEICEAVTEKVTSLCANRLEQNLMGFSRDGKGMKFADFYRIFFSTERLLQLCVAAVNRKIAEGKRSISGHRMESMKEMQATTSGKWQIPDAVDLEFVPNLSVDRLGEFCALIENVLQEYLPDEAIDVAILRSLELSDHLEDTRAISDKGGVKYRWYLAAGRYLSQHPGLDPNQLSEVMRKVAHSVAEQFREQLEHVETEIDPFAQLRDYIVEITDINGEGISDAHSFSSELTKYEMAKKAGRGKTIACSLCSSAFDTVEQMETAVLFAPQVYSNKLPLNKGKMKRGICSLCSFEIMLRRILMRGRLQTHGGGFESRKVKYLYIYPTYFFTTETGNALREMLDRLKDINLFDVRRRLADKEQVELVDFLNLEETMIDLADDEEEEHQFDPYIRIEFPKDDLANLFFLGVCPAERDPSETEGWVKPAYLALLLPIIFNAKVVATSSSMPLYQSGDQFKELAVIDGVPGFFDHLVSQDRFRIDELLPALTRLNAAYALHLDTYADGGRPHWNQVNEVARSLDTDALYTFHYLMVLERKKKWDCAPSMVAKRFIRIYQEIGGERMSMIKQIVNGYYQFYRAPGGRNRSAHSIHRPVAITITVVVKSDPKTDDQDLILEIIGELNAWLGRVHNRSAEGYAPLYGEEELKAVRSFAEFFMKGIFHEYCGGDRKTLNDRANRIKAACEAYYLENYSYKKKGDNQKGDSDVDDNK